jgi:hypothetical protein
VTVQEYPTIEVITAQRRYVPSRGQTTVTRDGVQVAPRHGPSQTSGRDPSANEGRVAISRETSAGQ